MAWGGYIALGASSAGVFTELALTGYARQPWVFSGLSAGRVAGVAVVEFALVSGTDWTWDALAFFDAPTGGTAALVYPLANQLTAFAGTRAHVNPQTVSLDTVDFRAAHGAPLDPAQVSAITGIPVVGGNAGTPSSGQFAAAMATLLATLPTSLPAGPGEMWNNGGTLAVS